MGDDKKAITKHVPEESFARRSLIRSFEGQIIAKAQEENGQDGDHQAPMTLIRNPDGSPRKVVAATTDRKLAEDLVDAIRHGVPFVVNLHHAPSEEELEELSHQLPMAQPPPPALGPVRRRELPARLPESRGRVADHENATAGLSALASRGDEMSKRGIRLIASRDDSADANDQVRPRRGARRREE